MAEYNFSGYVGFIPRSHVIVLKQDKDQPFQMTVYIK